MSKVASTAEDRSKTKAAVQQIRKRRLLTQSALAVELGVSTNTVARWESGRVPDGTQAKKLMALALEAEAMEAYLLLAGVKPKCAAPTVLAYIMPVLRRLTARDLPVLQVAAYGTTAERQVFEITKKLRDVVDLLDLTIASSGIDCARQKMEGVDG